MKVYLFDSEAIVVDIKEEATFESRRYFRVFLDVLVHDGSLRL